MSLDYPNRKVWLAKRYTPRDLWRRVGRWFFVNGTYSRNKPDYAAQCNGNANKKRERRAKDKAP